MPNFDLKDIRKQMVLNQVKTWEVSDPTILSLLSELPRELFVPEAYQSVAYADTWIPLPYQEVLMPPKMVGRIVQNLQLHPSDTVLHIGCATGYMTALLANLTKEVTAVEIHADFLERSRLNLKRLNLDNVNWELGDGAQGWDYPSTFDVIVISGGLLTIPEILRQQLRPEGRLFAIYGNTPSMRASVFHYKSRVTWQEESLFESDLPYLIGAEPSTRFVF